MCVCSELTQPGKEKFSQQQLTVKWTRETEKKGMLNTEQLVIWRDGRNRQVKVTVCRIFVILSNYCHSKFYLQKRTTVVNICREHSSQCPQAKYMEKGDRNMHFFMLPLRAPAKKTIK